MEQKSAKKEFTRILTGLSSLHKIFCFLLLAWLCEWRGVTVFNACGMA